jgi:alkylhydroperoxidase family enzyme
MAEQLRIRDSVPSERPSRLASISEPEENVTMPRLRQVPRTDVSSSRVLDTYTKYFGNRDPVSEPGTESGTPGNWWTVFALDPELFSVMLDRHAWQFSDKRELDPVLRELALARTGWVAGSSFVFSQHSKLLRRLGAGDARVAAVPSWSSEDCFSDVERAVLGFTDDVVTNWGRVSDGRFAKLKSFLSDEAILELAFMITTYVQSASLCRALRLELDDYPDPIVDKGAT